MSTSLYRRKSNNYFPDRKKVKCRKHVFVLATIIMMPTNDLHCVGDDKKCREYLILLYFSSHDSLTADVHKMTSQVLE